LFVPELPDVYEARLDLQKGKKTLKKIGLLFSGQGAQYVGMGKDLAEHSTGATALFGQAETLFGKPFKQVCFEGPEALLTETGYCQPALFVHGLALLAELKKRVPQLNVTACAGLSLGEFTAHAAAGHLAFADGFRLVAERGRLMQEACARSEGGMVTLIGATSEQAEQVAAKSGLEVANYNCPGQIVLSGAKSKVPAALEAAKETGLRRAIPLNVAGAYHSSLMKPAQEGLAKALEQTVIVENDLPVWSNVTAGVSRSAGDIRDTLLRQVTGSVRWEGCVRGVIASGVDVLVELGPGKVLAGMCKRIDETKPCLTAGNWNELEEVARGLS
jgi:[acyl-carrier-protein] S-malonyltransferase